MPIRCGSNCSKERKKQPIPNAQRTHARFSHVLHANQAHMSPVSRKVSIKRIAFAPSKLSRNLLLRPDDIRHTTQNVQSRRDRDRPCILAVDHRYTECTFRPNHSPRLMVVLHVTRTAVRRLWRSADRAQQCVHSTTRPVSTSAGIDCSTSHYRILPTRNHCQS